MASYEEETCESDEIDNFKPIFKKYKRRDQKLDVSDVIDFDSGRNFDKVDNFKLNDISEEFPGLYPVSDWKAYVLRAHPGFLFIVNPFRPGFQRYWVNRCVKDYPCRPSVRNLDAYMKLENDVHIWKDSFERYKADIANKESLSMKLRWVTMGYHYDWNTKKYYQDRKAPFPADMSWLGRYVGAAIGFPKFSPEAAVLNYYHLDSALSGHTDHSEFDHSAPLISFSFGQECIFLVGGETKETQPSAIFLRSGDICIMSAEARLVYHAVPRIIPTNPERIKACFHDLQTPDCAAAGVTEEFQKLKSFMLENMNCDDWTLVENYLSQTRINFNIRQVLPPDIKDFPHES